MEKMNDLRDLLRHEIQDLYSVEEQIISALPDMIDKANNVTLKNTLSEHLRITEEHKNRLDKVRQMLGEEVEAGEEKKEGLLTRLFKQSHVCKGMEGIIDEGNKIISEDMETEVRDAAIIASSQKIEHYEICGYGTARTYARELGLEQAARLLEQTLKEEYEADDKLTALAVTRINKEAEFAGGAGGDTSASGSAKGRTGRETTKSRVREEEMEMEPVSTDRRGKGTKRETPTERTGRPATSSPRTASGGRSADTKKNAGSSRGAASKPASRSSSRSASTGRGGNSGTPARKRK